MNFVYFIGAFAAGLVCIRYRKWIVDNTARVYWAERILGAGGTYTMWIIVGTALMAVAFWALFNV